MKIAVVGKGGSGKSTISWFLIKKFEELGKKVLAIDADYNMDLTSNLGDPAIEHYINQSEPDFYEYLDLTEKDFYNDLPNKPGLKHFSLQNIDSFSKKYATEISHNVRLMTTGPTRKDNLFGHRCSHAFVAPLKYYLPLLDLKENEIVIVDSVAGTDMVSYGLYLGVDLVLVVVEPTNNSKKVYEQIKEICQTLKIPAYAVQNKLDSLKHSNDYLAHFSFDKALAQLKYNEISEFNKQQIDQLFNSLQSITKELPKEDQWLRHKEWRVNHDIHLAEAEKNKFSFLQKKH